MIDDYDEEDYHDGDFDEERATVPSHPVAEDKKQQVAALQKKHQRELLRQIWMATETDDFFSCMEILK